MMESLKRFIDMQAYDAPTVPGMYLSLSDYTEIIEKAASVISISENTCPEFVPFSMNDENNLLDLNFLKQGTKVIKDMLFLRNEGKFKKDSSISGHFVVLLAPINTLYTCVFLVSFLKKYWSAAFLDPREFIEEVKNYVLKK